MFLLTKWITNDNCDACHHNALNQQPTTNNDNRNKLIEETNKQAHQTHRTNKQTHRMTNKDAITTEHLVNKAKEFYSTVEQLDRLPIQERSNCLELNKNGPVTPTRWPMGRALRQQDPISHLLLCPNWCPQNNDATVGTCRAGLKMFGQLVWPFNQ